MTYEEYKEHLKSQGWLSCARYMRKDVESACDMQHRDCLYTLTVSDKPGGVTANAFITLPGFMNLIATGEFGTPWDNKMFFTQVRRLEKIKRLVGDQLYEQATI